MILGLLSQAAAAAAAAVAPPPQPLPTPATAAVSKRGPSLLASGASLTAIVVADFSLRKAFLRAGLTFPSSLAGMVGLFAGERDGGGGGRGRAPEDGGRSGRRMAVVGVVMMLVSAARRSIGRRLP